MGQAPSIGDPGSREDEVVEKESWAIRFLGLVRTEMAGKLTLTDRRVVWTASQRSTRYSWEAAKETLQDVCVEPQALGPFWRYILVVESAGRKHRFEVGGETKAEEWAKAIRTWANLSA
jgi:hypothetical protein